MRLTGIALHTLGGVCAMGFAALFAVPGSELLVAGCGAALFAMTPLTRALAALALLAPCMLLADRLGLVTLIASGYRALAWALILLYVLPLLLTMLVRGSGRMAKQPEPS